MIRSKQFNNQFNRMFKKLLSLTLLYNFMIIAIRNKKFAVHGQI